MAGGPDGPAADLCARYLDPGGVLLRVAREYQRAVFSDCRVANMILRLDEPSEFANAVVRYSAWLWECQGAVKDQVFGLAWQADALTSTDAAILTEHYLGVCTAELRLSSEERADMKKRLEVEAEAAIRDPSENVLSMSVCDGGQGGQGTAGAGGGAGAAGAGGSGEAAEGRQSSAGAGAGGSGEADGAGGAR